MAKYSCRNGKAAQLVVKIPCLSNRPTAVYYYIHAKCTVSVCTLNPALISKFSTLDANLRW